MPDTATGQTPGTGLETFIAGMPKAELHVHHVGSASPRIVAELAARHTDSAVPTDPAALASYFDFRDFAHFIEIYLSVVDLIRDAEDVRLLTYEVARDMARQHIRYAELTVTPYSSTTRGIPEQAFMEAIEDARSRPSRSWASSCAGASTSPARPGCPPRRRPRAWRWTCGPRAWSPSAWAGRRSACRGRSSNRSSTGPGPRACTASRTPARPPGRRRSGTRSATWGPSGSATAPSPRRTRRCWTTWASTASRSRSARPRTSPPARSPSSTSTRCGGWSSRAPGHDQQRRPADVRHRPQHRVRGRRQAAGAGPRRGRRAGQERGGGVLPRPAGKARLAAEIDTYTASWS